MKSTGPSASSPALHACRRTEIENEPFWPELWAGRQLVIALSVHDYLALIVGGVLLAVAWVMVEATRIADENASFV